MADDIKKLKTPLFGKTQHIIIMITQWGKNIKKDVDYVCSYSCYFIVFFYS